MPAVRVTAVSLRFRVLGSGSTGNATLVEAAGTRILIDAGLGPRELAERLQAAGVDPASLAAIFLSHEHSDHARGAAAFSAKWGVRLCGSRGHLRRRGLRGGGDRGLRRAGGRARTRQVGALTRHRGAPCPTTRRSPLAFVVARRRRDASATPPTSAT